MANFTEQDNFTPAVPRVEEGDLVLGGENGIVNVALLALVNRTRSLLNSLNTLTSNNAETIFNATYKIGHIYINANDSRNPSEILGFGTWEAFGAGRALFGIDTAITDFDTAAKLGGARTLNLSDNQVGTHGHSLDQSNTEHEHRYDRPVGLQQISYAPGGTTIDVVTGINNDPTSREPVNVSVSPNGQSADIDNLPPYIVVYMWKRTA